MKKYLIILFIFLICTNLLISQIKIDSLKTQLEKASGEQKVEILNKLAKAYWDLAPNQSLEYSNQALKLSEKLKYNKGKALSLLNIGIGYTDLSNYDTALEYLLKSLKILKELGEDKYIASSLNNIGAVYYYLGNYSKTLEYYFQSLAINETIGDKNGVSGSLNNIGIVYFHLNNNDKALEYFIKSLKIKEEIGDKKSIAVSLNNIGIIYQNISNYDKALEYHLKSLKIKEEIDDKSGISFSLNNIGIIYQRLNNYDEALKYLLNSLKIKKEIENNLGIAACLGHIGEVYLKMENYSKASLYLERSLQLAEEIQARDLIMHCYDVFSVLYTAKEDYQKALEYYKLYTEEKDSIFTEESSEKIAEMQTKYETEKKEKENEILKKDNDIQKLEINKQQNLRNSFIVISALVLILAFVIYTRYRSKQKTNIILNQKNTEIENANTELNQKNKQITKQKNQLSITLKELRETQKMLTDTAHRAGMAEIATGILHNVGNVLNSVKVSSQILKEKIISSKVNNLQKVLILMEEHIDNIGAFITSDEKGKMLPEYLLKVGVTLKEEQDNSLKELSTLHNGINHIEEIIAVQQSYAGVSGLVEKVALSDMMDDVLKMHTEMFRKYKIKITKKYSQTKSILIEKGKLIQVFVNLLKNAKESLETNDEKDRIITINISEYKQHQTVEITDNGTGISKENLTKIFSYGFSTKKAGKGFGLHTSALAMTELKGKLFAESDGKGAKFIVSIPGNSK